MFSAVCRGVGEADVSTSGPRHVAMPKSNPTRSHANDVNHVRHKRDVLHGIMSECCLNAQEVVLCILESVLLNWSETFKTGPRIVFIMHSNSISLAELYYGKPRSLHAMDVVNTKHNHHWFVYRHTTGGYPNVLTHLRREHVTRAPCG